MTTSENSKKVVTIDIADSQMICKDFILSKDKHAITLSMTIVNSGQANLLLSVNNFFLLVDNEHHYPQNSYVNDGQQFELLSGWKSFDKDKSYTLITKYAINPNLSTYELCYKTTNQMYSIIQLYG